MVKIIIKERPISHNTGLVTLNDRFWYFYQDGLFCPKRPSVVFLRETDHLDLYNNKIREIGHF